MARLLFSALALIVVAAIPAAAQPFQAEGLDLQPDQVPYRQLEALHQELAAELRALEVQLDALQGGPGFAPTTRLNGQATFVLGKPATGKQQQ